MNCLKCGKEMGRTDGGPTIRGICSVVTMPEDSQTRATIEYNNLQLGKYSDGNGECHVGICLECDIDRLLL